jgi:hypothetical protein
MFETLWHMANGQTITVSQMGTRHIINALASLRRRGYVSPSTVSFYVSCPEPWGDGSIYFTIYRPV